METNISNTKASITTNQSRSRGNRSRRSSNKNKKSTEHPTTSQVVSMVKSIKNSQKQLKFLYNDSTTTSLNTTPNFFDITSLITQGVTSAQRVGYSIQLKELQFNVITVLGDTTNLIRLVCFRWRPSTTSDTPSIGELMNSSVAPWVGQFLPFQPSRFQILSDVTFNMDAAHVQLQTTYTVPLKGIITQYDLSANTGMNHIYLMYVSDSGVAPNPTIRYTNQLLFKDTE
jgi:hypothetical protein